MLYSHNLGSGIIERAIADLVRLVADLLHDRGGMQNMVFAHWGQIWQRTHDPVQVSEIIRISVAEPVGVVIVHATARDLAVQISEVSRVIHRSKSILAGLFVSR